MKVFRSLRGVRGFFKSGSAVSIGVFDGVHKGHRRVIDRLESSARAGGIKSAVLTFSPHPLKVVRPGFSIPNLISLEHRIRLIGELGIDSVVVLRFSAYLASLGPEDFVRRVLVGSLNSKEVFVGENFYFGRGAGADAHELKEIASRLGISVRIVRSVCVKGVKASSSIIRSLILKGELKRAESFLGRPVSVLGTVVKGRSIARKLGFPTANINPHHEVVPPSGVYAVHVRLDNKIMGGVLNIGTRPTFYAPRDSEPNVEVHVFGFNKNIYGRDIEVLFVKKLRDEKRFGGMSALKRRISLDARLARHILQGKKVIKSH